MALAVVGSFFIDEPLRRVVVRQMNRQLKGYSADIRKLSFHPIGLSLTLYDLRFLQEAHPEPPVFHAPRLDASVEWKALLRGRLVADFALTQPAVYVNLQQLRAEAADPTPVKDHGWQEAFQAIYPLKINEVRVTDGRITYVDEGPFAPLEVTRLNLTAQNIRNIRSKDRTYPSDVHLDAVVFQNGRVALDGHADFLAVPIPGIQGDVKLDAIALDYFKPVLNRGSVAIEGGTLSAAGAFEYGPTVRVADLKEAKVSGMKIEYVQTAQTAGVPEKAARKTAQAVQRANNAPDLVLRAGRVELVDSRVGFVNKRTAPAYRAFIDVARLHLENFTNHRTEGQMTATLDGRFMGSGATKATAHFRPEVDGPDFDLRLAIENTDLRTMNDMLRAHGKFDVVAGVFSFYSELAVKNAEVRGWVKPLFRDVQAYDPAQDRDKSAMRKLYEKVVTGVAKVMKNVPRKEVATEIDVSGR
ncbi:MAG: AsmA family protein, partial [Candidatus Rokuibacteriota bacterium]